MVRRTMKTMTKTIQMGKLDLADEEEAFCSITEMERL